MLTQLIFLSSSCLNSMGMTKKKKFCRAVSVRRFQVIQSCSTTVILSCVFSSMMVIMILAVSSCCSYMYMNYVELLI